MWAMETKLEPETRLKVERLRRGWSIADLTMRTGINAASLSLVERGLTIVHPGWQERLALALEMPVEDLFVPGERRALPPVPEA